MKYFSIVLVFAFLVGVDEVSAAFLGVELEPGYIAGQPAVGVRSVAPRSPAAAAGFLPGDIISRVARQPVTRPEDVVAMVGAARPGSRMEIEVLRAGQRVPLTVTLADSSAAPVPADAGGSVPGNETLGPKLGLPANGVAFAIKESPHCSVLAPPGWNFQSNANASTAEAQSADRRIYAGWGVTAINRAQEQYYGPLFGAPETSMLYLAQQVAQQNLGDASNLQYVSAPQPFLGYFTLRRLESARTQGYVFFRLYPGPVGPQSYIESVYFALADKALGQGGLAIASGVAVSLRCVTQLVPTRNDPPRRGNANRKKPTACGTAEGNLKGYNKELGVQWTHTANGTNILMDATTAYENGPDGPGWYARTGNSKEKLQLGRSDDC